MGSPEMGPVQGGDQEKTPLDLFREEMTVWKEKEASGERKTAHLEFVNPEELDELDMAMWRAIKDREPEVIEKYEEYSERTQNTSSKTKQEFLAFIRNKMMSVYAEQDGI